MILLASCQSNQQIENTFDQNFIADSSDLIFTSPNFSAMHAPPLMAGFTYVETFIKETFCAEKKPSKIGKVTVTKANKTQYSKLPSGDIVALIGYHAVGATGGGLKGATYYSFKVKPKSKYRITVKEARPFVTSYNVAIEEMTGNGAIAVSVVKDRKNICKSS